jgi:Zn-dependent protease with chaperone function
VARRLHRQQRPLRGVDGAALHPARVVPRLPLPDAGPAVGAFLAWVPYASYAYLNRIHFQLTLFCLIGAFIILKAVVPRPDRFTPPGPPLVPDRHPRLFAEIRRTAESVRQAMPAEVYLVPEVNAWVSQRGGIMGIGGRRIMGIGLALLQILKVSELRAVIAHEFGHYHGGDVKLGPVIYKTREALVRTVLGLAQHSGALTKPFEWNARLFFRVSHAVSRHQESQADALAARVTGAPALARGLIAVHRGALAFPVYWAGYDTHPSLRERLDALEQAQPEPAGPSEPSAVTLLDSVPELEGLLLASLTEGKTLRPLAWDDVGATVLLPRWTSFLKEHGHALHGVTPAAIAGLDWAAVGRALARSTKQEEQEGSERFADFTIGAAVAVVLTRRGFTLEAPPGASPVLKRGALSVEPFDLRSRLAAGGEAAEEWRHFCSETGIGDVDLGAGAEN